HNEECVRRMTHAVRGGGAVPAWIGVVDGTVTVGLADRQLARFCEPGAAAKVARRDVPMAVTDRALGATTVSATIWAAAAAGLRVGATGGIGGVHPGEAGDVSADLLELATTPGLLVCSGPKSILDPVATADKLEELGVSVVGYGVDRLPFFLTGACPVELEHTIDTPVQGAEMLASALALGMPSTLVIANPVPRASAMASGEVEWAVREAERLATEADISGKGRTPFLLGALAELTDGRSLAANLDLLECNAELAGEIAAAHASAHGSRRADPR
ncbi:MAG TPA: pseudouridine-5'-phosphate glycosidase, partial [Actinomycetota bacterium]